MRARRQGATGDAGRARLVRRAPLLVTAVAAAVAVPLVPLDSGRAAIPAFARIYRTGCSTCHTAAPKLNVMGEVFRLNGYRFPEGVRDRQDDPVPLGAEPWKDQWPDAIWPGQLPELGPVAFRIQTDVQVTADERLDFDWTYRFPHEIYVLAGAPLGDQVSAFLESEWNREGGFGVRQAKVLFQDPVPGLPDRSLNLAFGLLDPYLLSFTNRQTDRAARQPFDWQFFAIAGRDLLTSGGTVEPTQSLRLGGTLPAIELNGIAFGRLHYGLGLSQGGAATTVDNNRHKDLYYKLRYKLGGLDLTGRYPDPEQPTAGKGGQLYDYALILEHFGYFGDESTADAPTGGHRAFGLSARALYGPLDAGVGFVTRSYDQPWGLGIPVDARAQAIFGKVEYLVLPWVLGSLKLDALDLSLDPGVAAQLEAGNRTRVLPGVVLLIRQNVRAVVEGEIFLRHEATAQAGLDTPHNLWLRLDLAF